VARDLGVQGYCFRHFKNIDELIERVRAVGVRRVELGATHVNFNDEGTWEGVLGALKGAGIEISSLGVVKLRGEAQEEGWFRFAKAAGCRLIAMTFDHKALPGVIPATEKWAEKYDVLLGIHNHGGFHWLGNLDMMSHVVRNCGPRVGVCLDTAWAMQSGEDVMKWVETLREKTFGMHVKDFVFDRAGRWKDVVVGTGNLPLKEVMAAAVGMPGMEAITVEYEGDVEDPVPAVRACVEAVRGKSK
jgi:sugar phosphate isomerase/epimerase